MQDFKTGQLKIGRFLDWSNFWVEKVFEKEKNESRIGQNVYWSTPFRNIVYRVVNPTGKYYDFVFMIIKNLLTRFNLSWGQYYEHIKKIFTFK